MLRFQIEVLKKKNKKKTCVLFFVKEFNIAVYKFVHRHHYRYCLVTLTSLITVTTALLL